MFIQIVAVVLHHQTTINTHTNNNNMNTHTQTSIHTKDGHVLTFSNTKKVKHNQKDTTNGAKRVRVENYKDMALNAVVRVMQKSDRANKQREDRRAKRTK